MTQKSSVFLDMKITKSEMIDMVLSEREEIIQAAIEVCRDKCSIDQDNKHYEELRSLEVKLIKT